MALVAGYHLQVGSTVVEDGTGTRPYKVTYMSFPEPEPDGRGGHHPATRRFDVTVEGSSVSDLHANIAALRRECVRDKTLYFRPSASGDLLSCRIREASVVEREVDMLDRVSSEAELSVTLVTDPYWLAPWGVEWDVALDITTVPGHIDIPDPGGEVDALLSMRVVPAREASGLYVGVKPDPSADYKYVDDYGASGSGVADTNAYGGYKVASVGLDATLSEHWTAPVISHIANEGWHIAIARVDTTATTPGNVDVQARVTTGGADIVASTSVDYQPVALVSADLREIELGTVQIPACGAPESGEGSYSVPYSEAQSTDQGTRTFTSALSGSVYRVGLQQTFPWPDGSIASAAYTIDTAPVTGTILDIYLEYVDPSFGDIREVARALGCSTGVGSHIVDFLHWSGTPGPFETVAREYILRFDFHGSAAFSVGLAYANGVYTNGALTQTHGTGLVSGDDLVFSVNGSTLGSKSTSMPLLAACSDASQTVNLDYVQRIPADYACIAYRLSSPGPIGLYYDAGTDTPYVADADGRGPSIYEECTIIKPLRLKPGVMNRVVFGILQGDIAPAGMTALKYWIRKRYLTATG